MNRNSNYKKIYSVTTMTPHRISFAGGGTDIPSFYKKNSYGSILSCAINKYIYVSVKKHSKLYPEKIRLNYSETEQVQSVDKIKNPIIKKHNANFYCN